MTNDTVYKQKLNDLIRDMLFELDGIIALCKDSDESIEAGLFLMIIIELSKMSNDVRYCSNPKCRCWPENTILGWLRESKELDIFLADRGFLIDILDVVYNYTDDKQTIFTSGYMEERNCDDTI